MPASRYVFLTLAGVLFVSAAVVVGYDLLCAARCRQKPACDERRWRTGLALVLMAWAPLLMALCIRLG